jgi:methyl-accepting chemotaxis protein
MAQEFATRDDELRRATGTTIETVINRYRDSSENLCNSSQQLRDRNNEVQDDVANVLVNLQFQDRVGQMLGHVTADVNKLNEVLVNARGKRQQGGIPDAIDVKRWLRELEQTYTTLEQVQIHRGGSIQQAAKKGSSDVTFF